MIFFAGTAWDANRFPDQHMAERLAKYVPVYYVDPPLSAAALLRRDANLQQVSRCTTTRLDDQLYRITVPSPPWPTRPGVRLFADLLRRRAARRIVTAREGRPVATICTTLEPMFERAGGDLRVLYVTDDLVNGADLLGRDRRTLRRQERSRLRESDLVVCCSDELQDRWRSMGARTVLLTNGVDEELFARTRALPPAPDVHLQHPIAGFVGHLSDRIDLATMTALAETGLSILLVGPRQGTFDLRRMAALLRRENVQWVGPKPYRDLPRYLAHMDVGLVPYGRSRFNDASFPLKTLEYLAAGIPVVSTDIPASRGLRPAVVVEGSEEGFVAQVLRSAERPLDQRDVEARRRVASRYSWESRARALAELVMLDRG